MIAKNAESLRLFFALWPDDATASALTQLQSAMHGRIVPYANLHLTLVFLGQQPTARLPDLKDALAHLPRAEITLKLDRLGYFPRKRLAWIGSHDTPGELLALHRSLIEALCARHIEFNSEHDYKPHVTLARDAVLPPDMAFDPVIWTARQAALVQSDTTPKGPIYRVLASRRLDEDVWLAGEAR